MEKNDNQIGLVTQKGVNPIIAETPVVETPVIETEVVDETPTAETPTAESIAESIAEAGAEVAETEVAEVATKVDAETFAEIRHRVASTLTIKLQDVDNYTHALSTCVMLDGVPKLLDEYRKAVVATFKLADMANVAANRAIELVKRSNNYASILRYTKGFTQYWHLVGKDESYKTTSYGVKKKDGTAVLESFDGYVFELRYINETNVNSIVEAYNDTLDYIACLNHQLKRKQANKAISERVIKAYFAVQRANVTCEDWNDETKIKAYLETLKSLDKDMQGCLDGNISDAYSEKIKEFKNLNK